MGRSSCQQPSGASRSGAIGAVLLGLAILGSLSATRPLEAQMPESGSSGDSQSWDYLDTPEAKPDDRALVRLPLSFAVTPDSRLYFNGARIRHVLVEWSPQRGLTLNGRSWIPREPDAIASQFALTDEDYVLLFRRYPYVARLLSNGWTGLDACHAYWRESERIELLIDSVYYASIDSGLPAFEASNLSLLQGAAADTAGIFDFSASHPSREGMGVVLQFAAGGPTTGYPLRRGLGSKLDPPPDRAATPTEAIPDERTARINATRLYQALAGPRERHCLVLIPQGWQRTCDEAAELAFRQIDKTLAAPNPTTTAHEEGAHGPLGYWTLRRIAFVQNEGKEGQ
jgi:hypothetical protein